MVRAVFQRYYRQAVVPALILCVALAAMACGGREQLAEATATPDSASNRESPEPEFVVKFRTFRIVPEETEATFEVGEEIIFLGISFRRTVGRTNAVEGDFSFGFDEEGELLMASNSFRVDLRTLTTDDTRRDERIREEFLESDKFPFAEFTGQEVRDFPPGADEGITWEFKLKGKMTIREKTRSLTYDIRATLNGERLEGTATTHLLMKDFGFDPPEIPGLFKVEDGVDVTLKFAAIEVGSGK